MRELPWRFRLAGSGPRELRCRRAMAESVRLVSTAIPSWFGSFGRSLRLAFITLCGGTRSIGRSGISTSASRSILASPCLPSFLERSSWFRHTSPCGRPAIASDEQRSSAAPCDRAAASPIEASVIRPVAQQLLVVRGGRLPLLPIRLRDRIHDRRLAGRASDFEEDPEVVRPGRTPAMEGFYAAKPPPAGC